MYISSLLQVEPTYVTAGQALWRGSSETLKRFLPLALRAASTRLPLAVLMRSLKPCLFFLLRCEG